MNQIFELICSRLGRDVGAPLVNECLCAYLSLCWFTITFLSIHCRQFKANSTLLIYITKHFRWRRFNGSGLRTARTASSNT